MIFEGDMSVIDALKEKKRLMDEGKDHGHIKPLMVVDGGLMKGAYAVGGGLALEALGYTDVFDTVVGISSGAPFAAYFVSGEVHVGASMIWEECCSRKFLNIWRFWNQVDTDYVVNALKKPGVKALNVEKVFSTRSKLYIGVANFKTGKPKLLLPTTAEEIYTSIQASILMPNVSNDIVYFKDIRYVDGGFTKPHILQLALDEIEATHVLIMTNQNHFDQLMPSIPKLERFLNHTLFRLRMPGALRFAAHERWRERLKVIEKLKREKEIPYALIWGDRSIRSMERDAVKVKAVVEKSRQWWLQLLQQ